MTDIVIPLSNESPFNNLQLKIALRSIAKNASNLGKIHIVTDVQLPWLQNVNIIRCGDPEKHCKDVNLINKIKKAAQSDEVSERFMFWSDDQFLTDKLDLDKAPVVGNSRTIEQLRGRTKSKWQERLLHTMRYVEEQTGVPMQNNFDSHVPQPYKKADVNFVFNTVPYTVKPGFCINTIYYGMLRQPQTAKQEFTKSTFERGFNGIPVKLMLYSGVDDQSFSKGMAHFFTGLFYEPCCFQKV